MRIQINSLLLEKNLSTIPKSETNNPSSNQIINHEKKMLSGTSLVVQGLRLHISSARGLGSIPGQGTRSHMPQLRVFTLQLKTPHAMRNELRTATNTGHSQINKQMNIFKDIK